MRNVIWFAAGVAATVLIAGGFLGVFVRQAEGFSTRAQPSGAERWLAVEMRHMAVPSSAKNMVNPIADSAQVIQQARAHWADHCASCHANNGSGNIAMGKQLYPPSPDLRQPATQTMTDGELFYIIENGIRLTGMPAWGSGTSHDAEDSWKLVRFIRHLPAMTPAEDDQMKELNPRTREELKEEQEERDFLNGDESHQPDHETSHHHSH